MFKKIMLAILIIPLVLAGLAWAYTANLDRQMDSSVLAERLESLPVPTREMVLIDEWARDGFWGIQSRGPEAGRVYITAGSVAKGCQMLDEFYDAASIAIAPTARSGDPSDWCGRSISAPGGRVSVWVEEPRSWTSIPAQFEGVENLVTIEYRAHR